MAIDSRLLDILCCPVSRLPVRPLDSESLRSLNGRIEQGQVLNVDGKSVDKTLQAALITQDGKVIYRIDDDIPVMLAEEAISTLQFSSFP